MAKIKFGYKDIDESEKPSKLIMYLHQSQINMM
jgi:hypothetical protein